MELNYDSRLEPELELVESHPAVADVVPTAGSMVSEWFIELESLPGDLRVPHVVFRAVSDADGTISSIAKTVRGNWSVSGGYQDTAPDETETLQTIESQPEVEQTISHNHSRAHIEVVCEKPANMLFFKIERSPFAVYNLQRHSQRNGWSLYLTDPAQKESDPRTLEQLLEEQT